jgi:hypothetical protein
VREDFGVPSGLTPIVNRVVAIGRTMNGAETFIRSPPALAGFQSLPDPRGISDISGG